ncbi:hypothetical protein NDS46_31255 (plasmid) [Paenibacillus thiaminolyticus]|uniref:hypothetical protein n=1 Tax=Paenibacillus thiaminolyticus TaxID=49283 RepID=UPI00232C4036|nr:hypothetical protein [Paenibacillus thiaminolyticus]WCF11437.1 hypothetical protein NDS46_31255 [Paenibacillus thiaminolyticus]
MAMQLPKEFQQIIRLDGRDVFLEVLNNAFPIGKVRINFIEYDEKQQVGSRIKKNIPIYIDIEKFLVLAQDVKSGRMSALAKKAKEDMTKGGYKYAKEIYMDQGGVPAKKLEERKKARPDGKSLARLFKITPGEKSPWILSAETGPGEESETGLIIPKYQRPEEILRVPVSDEDFKKLILITEAHIFGFISSQYYVRANAEIPREQ